MIKYVKGDLFRSPAKILVNTVNTVGVMGKGVALEFKNQYPEMYYRYKQLCEDKDLDIGNLYLWRKEKKWVLLFPTKRHWRNPSKIEYIERGLQKLVENWDRLGADSIAFPRLGCGNGGLDWNEVRPLMEKYLKNIPMQIYIYVDNYKDPMPEHLQMSEIEKWFKNQNEEDGYSKFKLQLKDILENDTNILFDDGISAKMMENGRLRVCNNDTAQDVGDEQLCEFWNYIRDSGIVNENEIPCDYIPFSNILLSIMKKLEYIQPVIISDDGQCFSEKANAYQFVAE